MANVENSQQNKSVTNKPPQVKLAQNQVKPAQLLKANSTGCATKKYPKIQPAIAPKPVAVLPKPAFLPLVSSNGKLIQLSLNSDLGVINTSKRWVLPPRPRPGRKPCGEEKQKRTSVKDTKVGEEIKLNSIPDPMIRALPETTQVKLEKHDVEKGVTNAAPKKESPHTMKREDSRNASLESQASLQGVESPTLTHVTENKVTVKLEESVHSHSFASATCLPSLQTSPTSTHAKVSPKKRFKVEDRKKVQAPTIPPTNAGHTDVDDLKLSYLSKLKEQELIRNYIDVISNQIKELNFVQSGVITFDALNTKTKTKTPRAPSQHEQLESINTSADLDRFLGYLGKLSSLLNSARRRDNQDDIDGQINHYLDLTHNWKTAPQSKKFRRSVGIEQNVPVMKPSLILVGDVLNEMDDLIVQLDEPVIEVGVEDEWNDDKKKKKGCGFCLNGTPCLCLDDLEFMR